jgi:cytochrome P450
MHMAYLETRIVLATLFRRFALRLEPGHVVAVRKAVTLPAKFGMRMLPVARTERMASV